MNFIFFNPDEMRAESTSCYGHPLVKTPNLDALAAAGTRFEQAHVTHSVCSPSRCSVLTGHYPHVRGHRSLWNLLTPDEPNLFGYLHDAGYKILWAGKNDAFAPETLAAYIDEYGNAQGKGGWPKNPFAEDDPRFYSFLFGESGEYEDSSDYGNVQRAIDFLRSPDADEPFAIYLPLSNPHPPYQGPRGYHDMYDPDDLPALRPAVTEGKPEFLQKIRQSRHLDQLSDADFRKIQAVYLGQISYVDALLGDLLAALEASGHADDTAIFFWSDHGDWAGDYGLVEKWPSALDDTLTRVPFVAKIPGGAAGHVVAEPVQHHDLLPTVLDLADIPCGHSHFAESLVAQLHGAQGNPERRVFAEGGYDLPHDYWCFEGRPGTPAATLNKPGNPYYPKIRLQMEEPDTIARSVMIRTMGHKYIRRTNGQNELYDLVRDPLELTNQYNQPAYAQVQAELQEELFLWYLRTSDVTPWSEHPRGFPSGDRTGGAFA